MPSDRGFIGPGSSPGIRSSRAKAAVVLDLYARIFQGRQLTNGEYVISSDAKTSIQARCRCDPSLPLGKARLMRVEQEYDRGGPLSYRRLRRTPGTLVRTPRVDHGDRTVPSLGGTGHDRRALRLGPPGVLGGR